MQYKKIKIFLITMILIIQANFLLCSDVDTMLNEIELNMKHVKTVQATFIQNKKMAMFDMPVTITGELYIENPDMFAWVVKEPIEYTLIITDDLVKKWDPSTGVNKLSLKENPMFKAMIEQITFWFSGSYSSCKKDYDIEMNNKDLIQLKFTPKKHNQASNMLENIILVFQNNKKYISKIQLLEKNKDITEILFIGTKLNKAIDKTVWEIDK